MEEEMISQTRFDQLVSDDQSQMLKAFIPYLPPRSQQVLSVFTKARELSNTMLCFRADRQRCRSAPLLLLLLRIFWMISVNSAMAEAGNRSIRSAIFS